MIQAIPVSSYFLIKKYLKSFRKMRFRAVLSLGCRFVCLYPTQFVYYVFTFSVYFVLMLFCLFKHLVHSFTCLLVHLQQATYITTYILLGIGFLVLYLCIVIRNEGMTKGNFYKPNNL